ncbi:MAG: hypothetical protein AAF997_01755 [Myxococcota bacterium]
MKRIPSSLFFAAVLLAYACGSSTPSSDPEPSENEPGESEPEDPFYVLCGTLPTPDGGSTYAAIEPEISSDIDIDVAQTLEIPGFGACLPGAGGTGTIFTASGAGPIFSKWNVRADGSFEEAGRVSFANLGVQSTRTAISGTHFISETKAYFLDSDSQQLIVWNPDALEIVGTISLAPLLSLGPEGSLPEFATAIGVDDQVLILGGFADLRTTYATEGIAVGFIDPTTDTFSSTSYDPSCGNVGSPQVYPDGTIYLASNARMADAYYLGEENAFAPCLARILPGETEVDTSFTRPLEALTGTALTANLLRGPGLSGFVAAYDETIIPIDPMNVLRQIPSWRLYSVDDITAGEGATVTVVDGLAPSSPLFRTGFSTDGRTLVPVFSDDFGETLVFDITDGSAEDPLFFTPGVLRAIIEVAPEPQPSTAPDVTPSLLGPGLGSNPWPSGSNPGGAS